MNYTLIHLHSDLSNGVTNIDSVTKYTAYIQKAKECGMNAMCFTEHGSVFNWLKKKEAIEAAGMKYIHGEEFYVTESLTEKIRDNYHCVLIAKNHDGFRELNKLSSNSFNREDGHFYYVPRISMDELEGISENIILTTACLGGILSRGTDTIKDRFLRFLSEHKEQCFLEIQHHNVAEQKTYNNYLLDVANALDIRLITGTDTHALNADHLFARKILQHSKNVNFENEDGWDLSFKTYDELVSAYGEQGSLPNDVVLRAIENTNVLADMVEPFDVDRSYKYPKLWEDPEATLIQKIKDGIVRRGANAYDNAKQYYERIKYELSVYKHNGAIDFILLMDDVVEFCRANNIDIGWGRGSVTGSIICWLLGITQMDSIKFNLSFERFMNTERVSLADIDTDFPPSRREEVRSYLFHKHGLYCCDIITFNTIALNGAIRDICRGLYRDDDDKDYMAITNEICDMVDASEDKARGKYPEVFGLVDMVMGTIVSIGIHPCGVCVSDSPLEYDMGLCSTSTDEYPVSQIYMKEIDSLNYVKLDLLALDTIELISNTCAIAGIPMVTPDTLDVNDERVWKSIRDDTTQIFQYEGGAGANYIKQLFADGSIAELRKNQPNVDKMTLFTIGNSAIRPAGASYRDELGRGMVRTTGAQAIDEFLAPRFGYLVFQEDIIFFLNKYCGFTMGEADTVRRGFAKKTGTEQYIPRIKAGFVQTMQEQYGMSKEKAEADIVAFLKVIEDASDYLFSLNHSLPYSYEGYASGWLRYYYPVEFLTAALNINRDKEEKTTALTRYAAKVKVKIEAPKFRHSRSEYYCDAEQKTIYKGIGSVKYMSSQLADELYALRENEYEGFADLLFDIDEKTSMDTRQLDRLIKIGFFDEFGDTNKLLNVTWWYQQYAGRKTITKEEAGILNDYIHGHCTSETYDRVTEIDVLQLIVDRQIPSDVYQKMRKAGSDNEFEFSTARAIRVLELTDEDMLRYATKVVKGRYSGVDWRPVLIAFEKKMMYTPCTIAQKIRWQKEFLGYVDIHDDRFSKMVVVVDQLDTKFTPRFSAYSIKYGKSAELKVRKTATNKWGSPYNGWDSFDNKPFSDGDILLASRMVKMPVNEKGDDGRWHQVPDKFNWWIPQYQVINGDIDEALLYEEGVQSTA